MTQLVVFHILNLALSAFAGRFNINHIVLYTTAKSGSKSLQAKIILLDSTLNYPAHLKFKHAIKLTCVIVLFIRETLPA